MDKKRIVESTVLLKEWFPYATDYNIRRALLEANSSVAVAGNLLFSSLGSSSSAEALDTSSKGKQKPSGESGETRAIGKKVNAILQVCPGVSKIKVENTLKSCKWDVDRATEVILESFEDSSKGPQSDGSNQLISKELVESAIEISPPKHTTGIISSFTISTRSEQNIKQLSQSDQSNTIKQEHPKPGSVEQEFGTNFDNFSNYEHLITTEHVRSKSNEINPSKVDIQGNSSDLNPGDSNIEGVKATETKNETLSSGHENEIRLFTLYPEAGKVHCHNVLCLEGGDIETAIQVLEREKLEEDLQNSGTNNNSDTSEDSLDVGAVRSRLDLIRAGKRRADETDENQSSRKKARQESSDLEGAQLEPAGEWTIKYFEESLGYQIQLDSGVHPCKFPKVLLENFSHFRIIFENKAVSINQPIPLPNVDRDIFELAIQWAFCRQVRLSAQQSRTSSIKVTTMLDFVVLCDDLGLHIGIFDPKSVILNSFKAILNKNREAFKPQHVNIIYTLREGHPLRQFLVQSTLQEFVEFHSPGYDPHKDEDIEFDDQGLNPAQRAAFRKNTWRLQSVFNSVKEFRLELSELFSKAWMKRRREQYKSGKKLLEKVLMTDPLSGDYFIAR